MTSKFEDGGRFEDGGQHLRTPHLELVRTTLDHTEALFGIYGDAESVRFLPREPCQNLAACRELLLKMISVQARGQGIRWSILRQGQVIGCLGFHAWNRDQGHAYLSYEVIPAVRGKGCASQAVAAALRFGFAEMGLQKVLAEAHSENQPSLRLLKKAGFVGLGGYWRIWKGGGTVWFERYALVCPSRSGLKLACNGYTRWKRPLDES